MNAPFGENLTESVRSIFRSSSLGHRISTGALSQSADHNIRLEVSCLIGTEAICLPSELIFMASSYGAAIGRNFEGYSCFEMSQTRRNRPAFMRTLSLSPNKSVVV